jgi:tetratricopeptide (TPR) repeat protein
VAEQERIADLAERAHALLSAKDIEGAQGLFDDLLALSPKSRECLLVGAALAAVEDPAAALALVEEAGRLFSKDPTVLLTRASYLLELSEDAEAALPLLYEAVLTLEADGSDEARPALAEARVMLADCLLATGAAEDALRTAEAALAHDDSYVLAHLARAAALFTLCRLDEAAVAAADALSRERGVADVHHFLGRVAQARGDGAKAAPAFEEAHALSPERFPLPCRVSPERFVELLASAKEALPAAVFEAIEGSDLRVDLRPDLEALREQNEPIAPDVPCLVEVSPEDDDEDAFVLDSVVVYQANVELLAGDEDELLAALIEVITDEVVGALGLDDLREG